MLYITFYPWRKNPREWYTSAVRCEKNDREVMCDIHRFFSVLPTAKLGALKVSAFNNSDPIHIGKP